MEKEFVPYEQALELKELGFDEPCFDFYDDTKELFYNHENKEKIHIGYSLKAPTFSQAFRWFREKGYRFSIVSGESATMMYKYWFDVWLNAQFIFETDYIYNGYEEAELACIKKLIEIAKTK